MRIRGMEANLNFRDFCAGWRWAVAGEAWPGGGGGVGGGVVLAESREEPSCLKLSFTRLGVHIAFERLRCFH